jgi:hypothetical protein
LPVYFRSHHCLKGIHSEQCIGYVLKHYPKNSDAGRISLHNVIHKEHSCSWIDQS